MTHDQAREILADAESTITVYEEAGAATINGTVTIKQGAQGGLINRKRRRSAVFRWAHSEAPSTGFAEYPKKIVVARPLPPLNPLHYNVEGMVTGHQLVPMDLPSEGVFWCCVCGGHPDDPIHKPGYIP